VNLVSGGSGDGTITNAGSLIIAAGSTFTMSGTYNLTGTLYVPATATLNLTGTFTNFSGSTLSGGTYVIGGALMFANADIQTNAATIVLDGPAAEIVDPSNNDALVNFTTNAAAGSFTIQNGRNFATAASVSFTNVGVLVLGGGSTFTVAGTFSNAGLLVIAAGGLFAVTGIFANFSGMTLTGGTYDIGGTLQFANADIQTNAATVVLDGPTSQIVDLANNNALVNFTTNADAGTLTIQNGRNFATTASVSFTNVGVLVIGASSTFTVTGGFANFDGTTLTGGTYLISGTFQFAGADIQSNAANIVLDGPAARIVDLANNDALANFATNAAVGSFTIQNGRNFTPAGAFANAGTVIIGYGSIFTANGAYTQTGSAMVRYQGTLILAGGGSNSGNFTVFAQGLVLWVAGTFTLDAGTRLNGNGLFEIAGATVSIPDMVSVPNLELDSGVLTGAGALTITLSFTWNGGTMSGTGSTNLAAGSVFTISGAADKVLDGWTLNLSGTTTWSDSGNLVLADNAVINNGSGALFVIVNDQSIQGSGSFHNAGTLIKTTGTATTTFATGIAFSNNGGTVSVQSGTLSFAGDYTQNSGATILAAEATLAAGGTVNILDGMLSGSGTIVGNVVNSGQLNPVGILTIHGNYTQTARGTLNIEIGGTTAGIDFDQLVVTGLATLDGTLNISLTNGFRPNLGDRFQILNFGSRTGDFAGENGLGLGDGLRLDPQYKDSSLTLVTAGGNNAPPGGAASSNGSHHFPAWDEVPFSVQRGSPEGGPLWQAVSVANNGNKPRACLDTFFQLLAESTGRGGKPCGV
jgi:hypothetical protein